jgi:indole-3-glycerol phosphate synthase
MRLSRSANLPSVLRSILASRQGRLAEEKRRQPLSELQGRLEGLPRPRDFRGALEGGDAVSVIAEIKRRSPSRGPIRGELDLPAVVAAYEAGEADALSVLTEQDFFGGSLADLRRVRSLSRLPLLRKDFLFDPYQLYESRAAGADAVLLIAALLEPPKLVELLGLAAQLGLQALVEVHDAEELEVALAGSRAAASRPAGSRLAAGAPMIGINNRDLHSFRVSLETSLELCRRVPPGPLLVSESGIRTAGDVRRLAAAGIRAFLVGEALLNASDPCAALRALKEAS